MQPSGIFLFGFVEDITGDITKSILFLIIVFAIAVITLLRVPKAID